MSGGGTAGRAASLVVSDLHVAYGGVEAVRGVSLEVPAGSLVTLIGANGAGKSTTLAALSGLVRARGQILLDGTEISRWRSSRRVAEGLVQVPEGREVLATLTVEDNLRLGAWHQRDHLAAGLDGVFARFPILAERRELSAGSLSGGEQQMLAIARALLARPRVLLMDEPSMGLAPQIVDQVFAVIDAIRHEGTTVLLVEQNAHRALSAADTAYVMETGEIVMEGPAGELLANPRVVEAYLGELSA
ncbi:MAG: ABC transporter ATP-binding protein [Euzebyales bacterium]|jgi:branched-chain amino acid transport system ATP-binding protein|nr:ABC transporter ATP-binding protein [Euzebyales bacterium]